MILRCKYLRSILCAGSRGGNETERVDKARQDGKKLRSKGGLESLIVSRGYEYLKEWRRKRRES